MSSGEEPAVASASPLVSAGAACPAEFFFPTLPNELLSVNQINLPVLFLELFTVSAE